MVGRAARSRLEFWYRPRVVSRRIPLLLALALTLALTGLAQAQEPSAAPVSPTPMASAAALDDSPEASVSPAPSATPEASPDPEVEETPEVDFLVGDWELQKVRWKDLRMNGGDVLPVATAGPQDAKGVPMQALGPGGTLVYNPTVVAQQGMKRLDSYLQTGAKVHLRQARKYAVALERLSDGGKKRRWQPHWYDFGVHKKGWVNSNSHGLVLSFLARYYKLTDAKEKLEEAGKLVAAFENRPTNQRWFTQVTSGGYVWFEHWPDGRHDHTLNAHLNAMFGLYDYWLATGDPLAELYFLGGAKTVRDKLYRFRRKGELSRYSLDDRRGTLHYHETHIRQLRILALMTGDKWFDRQADRFVKDAEAWRAKYRGAAGRGGR